MDYIQVVYNAQGQVLLTLGDYGIELEREEAEALFIDLGHCLQDMDMMASNIEE